MHDHVVHAARAGELDMEMRGEFAALQDLLLDLGREDIDAPQDDHVVGAAGDLLNAAKPWRLAPRGVGLVTGIAAAIDKLGKAKFLATVLLTDRSDYAIAVFAIG